jgi:hypothetical protein
MRDSDLRDEKSERWNKRGWNIYFWKLWMIQPILWLSQQLPAANKVAAED